MSRCNYRYAVTTVLLVVAIIFSPFYASPVAQAKGPKAGLRSNVAISIQNPYLKLVASNLGRFAIGTTGGDPDSFLDDNRQLLFGYPTDVGTSFTTLRIGNGGVTTDYRLGASDWNSSGIAPIALPITDSTSITTIYEQDGVRVEEKAMFAYNESTGRPDTTAIQYTVVNNSGAYRTVGLRILMDIMVGNNDGAPYFIDGQGYVTHQSEWRGADVPQYWVSYESPIFATTSLRSRGQLSGGDAIAPDRFVIADWAQATQTTWEYAVNPQELVTSDSATILYYNPVVLSPGQNKVVRTYYGITRSGGVSMAQLTGLEVTQGIQNLFNSVPLIENRMTYVRAHMQSTLGVIPGVAAQLSGSRDGVPLPGSPLAPANSGGVIDVLENADRQQLGQSFYFALPAEWLTGTIDLELSSSNRTIGCREIASTPNDCRAEVSFYPASAPELHFVGMAWAQTGIVHEPSLADLTFAQRQIASIFPVPHIDASFGSTMDISFLGGPPRTEMDFIEINTMLEVNRILDGCINSGLEGCKRFYLGVLIDRPVAVSASGWALNSPPSFIATAYLSDPFVLPHELAAATGQKHTLCAGDEDLPTQIYPYTDARISEATSGDEAFYGFDTNTRAIYPPSSRDIMSHCTPRWTSDWTYANLLNQLSLIYATPAPGPQASQLQAGESALLVSGIITFSNDTGRFMSTYVLPYSGSLTPPVAGDYTIRLENGSGATVASYPFAPRISAEDSGFGSFSMLLPWNASATRIVLLHGDNVLSTRTISSHAPTVQVLAPNGGENFTGPAATVQWTAADADGDALSYVVQYSSDAGVSWQTLASQWKPMTYTLDLTRLAGSNQALVRVIASDGMNTAQDQSDAPFSVARHAPVAEIVSPGSTAVYAGSQTVILDGYATDVEDGQLAGAALTWSSNRNGVLGTGTSLVLNAANLQEGAHTITLTALDSDGQTGVATVSIQIARVQPATPQHLEVAPSAMQFTGLAGLQSIHWQPLSIANSGDGALNWTATASEPWIFLSAVAGAAPTNLLIAASAAHLGPGTHLGTVTLTSATADNSPQVVTVQFSVLASQQIYLPVIVLNR